MGRIVKAENMNMQIDETTKQQLNAFLRGELTWAELEGMTYEEAKAIAQIGCDLAAAGRLEEARVIFEGLTAGNPKDAAARAALGTVYQKLGRVTDALTEYSGALEQDPSNPVALANRGELRLKRGDTEGLKDLANAAKIDPHGETAAGRRARILLAAVADAAAAPRA